MHYYRWRKDVIELNPEGYLINDGQYAKALLHWGVYTHEVDVINRIKADWSDLNKVFIDVGAHIGVFSWNLASHFSKTYSFEPQKEIFNYLCGNIALKGLSEKIETFNMGLSSKEDLLTFYTREHSENSGMGMNGFVNYHFDDDRVDDSLKLKVKPLDFFNIENVGFIKIDVEGHELDVLKGALNTLARSNYPPILFESWDSSSKFGKFSKDEVINLRVDKINFLKDLGYSRFTEWYESELLLATYGSSTPVYEKLDGSTLLLGDYINKLL